LESPAGSGSEGDSPAGGTHGDPVSIDTRPVLVCVEGDGTPGEDVVVREVGFEEQDKPKREEIGR